MRKNEYRQIKKLLFFIYLLSVLGFSTTGLASAKPILKIVDINNLQLFNTVVDINQKSDLITLNTDVIQPAFANHTEDPFSYVE